jgi:hypothetical protein
MLSAMWSSVLLRSGLCHLGVWRFNEGLSSQGFMVACTGTGESQKHTEWVNGLTEGSFTRHVRMAQHNQHCNMGTVSVHQQSHMNPLAWFLKHLQASFPADDDPNHTA